MVELTLHNFTTDYKRQVNRISPEDIQQKYGVEKVYRLWQNENPLGPSPKVIEAITQALPSLAYYPSFSDIELREIIAQTIGRGITPNHIYTGCSGFEALELLARGFVRPGDECIVSTPTFISAYKKTTTLAGAKIVDIPLKPETFEFDVESVIRAIDEKTRLIILCNPNNPTGAIITAGQFDRLMAAIPEHVLVVTDEVYHHFVDLPDYPDSLQYVLANKNLVIIHSFSKAYGLAGLRLGYGIARPELADYLASLHRGFHQNTIALAAGIAAFQDQDYLKHVVSFLKAEMQWLLHQLDQLGVKYWPPSANFVLTETQIPAGELTEKLMASGVMVRPQQSNGLPYCIRVSVGTREANETFIHALRQILHDSSSEARV